MKRFLFILYFVIVAVSQSVAQIYTKTFVAGGENSVTDAMVGSGGLMNTNMSTLDFINVSRDNQTTPIVYRTFLQYDISTIPREAILISAKLKLTVKTVSPINFSYGIERVADAWNSNSITWQNQPTTILSDVIKVEQPNSMTTVQEVDVYKHVYQMLRMPFFNNGWCIKLWDESISGTNYGNSYYSSDHSNSNLRPSLEITYMMPLEIEGTVTHCTAGNSDGTIDFTVTGGSSDQPHLFRLYRLDTATGINNFGMSYTYFHYVDRLTTIVDDNVIDADSLEPGVYVAQVFDSLHSKVPNYGSIIGIDLIGSKHFFVGREGEVTNISFTRDVDHMNVSIDVDGSVPNSEYINLAKTTNGAKIRAAFTGTDSYTSGTTNAYKTEAYFDLLADFPSSLEFQSANLIHGMHSTYQHTYSSNALALVPCTSDWTEKTVAWNYRPLTDSTQTIFIPKTTNPNGSTSTDDTLNILSFVEYWQNNPNYGLMLTLKDYTYPKVAYRQYKDFTAISQGRFEASFTVKSPVSAEFNDTTGLGSITVNAPAGNLPYTYLIGYDSIPELSVIWASIKDSIPIDSTTFFSGKINSTSYEFSGLPLGNYFISVFDNQGDKIMNKGISLQPEFKIYNTTNMSIAKNVIAPIFNEDAKGTVLGNLKSSESGGIIFEVENLGDALVGFSDLGQDEIYDVDDLEFGIKITENGFISVYSNGTLVSSLNIVAGEELCLKKVEDEFVLERNGLLEVSYPARTELPEILKFSLFLKKGDLSNVNSSKINLKLPTGFFKQTLLPIYEEKLQFCDENYASFFISNPIQMTQGMSLDATATNLQNGDVLTFSSSTDLVLNLPVGLWNVFYFINDINNMVAYPGSFVQLDVGYDVLWDPSSAVNHTVNQNNDLYSSPFAAFGSSTSTNNLLSTNVEFVSFRVGLNSTMISGSSPNYQNYYKMPQYYGIVSLVDVNNSNTEFAQVKVGSFGLNLLSKYIFVLVNGNYSTILAQPTSNNGNYRISYYNNPCKVEVYEDNNLLLSQNITTPPTGIIKIKGQTTTGAIIYDAKTSNCYDYPVQFVQLKRKLTGGYYQVPPDKSLNVEYFEEYNDLDNILNYKVIDEFGYDVTASVPITSGNPAIYGDNRFKFDVSTLNYGKFYILKVYNDKNESFSLRFKI